MEAYHCSAMPKAWQAAYHSIYTGLDNLASGFPVPRLEMDELGEILFRLRLDHPEIFYVTGFSCRVHPAASTVEFLPQYLFDKHKIQEHRRALSARVAKLARPAQNLSPWEQERYIHDFLCTGVRYDKLKKPYSHEILGPLGQGVGVCEGIAKSVKVLCDALGLWCVVVVSENALERGIKYRHAWNILRLDGGYYHLDATFDGTLGRDGPVRYDYFNLDDRRVFRDHQPLITAAPACAQGDRFYYREKKLSFTRLEDVSKRALQAIRKKQPLIFHWRGGPLTRETLGELTALLERAAQEKALHARIKLNWPQAVLQADFLPQPSPTPVTAQEANEGESDSAGPE